MKRLRAGLLALALLLTCTRPAQAGGGAAKGYLALTFDDGPSGAVTERLLEGLSQRRVHATFFVCGYRAAEYPEVLVKIAEGGHELGLHSSCHCYMQNMTKDEALSDLLDCRAQITEGCGLSPTLFRPPGGLYSPALLQAAEELGLCVILWSVDPCDWEEGKRAGVLPYLLSNTRAGDIILMHDLKDSSVQSALRFIDRMQAQGYEFCTVSELAAHSGVTLLPGQKYSCFRR